jgi:Family of unknown function (DUF6941)
MPELDFMVVADYVRAEGGVLHMIAAGFDTMYAASVPVMRQIGVGMRLTMTATELQYAHDVELVFQDADGKRVSQVNGTINPQPGAAVSPLGRPFAVAMAFNLVVPVPAYGDYSLELLIDHSHKKTISIVVAQPPAEPSPMLPGQN